MSTTTLAAPAVAPAELGLEARLAARDAEMTTRLEAAGMRFAVDAAQPETTVDLADVLTRPVDLDAPNSTPVAALLQRAALRLRTAGWCRDAARADSGGMCLLEAIRAEAHTHAEEGEARLLVRRALGGGDPIPEQNRRLHSAADAINILHQAANTAAHRGI